MAPRTKFQNRDAERHLKALGLSTYALTCTGSLYRGPCNVMPLSELLDGLDDVARRNKKAFHHVFIHGAADDNHDLILLGPTDEPFTEELKAAGHDPAAVVRVGPGHVETWLRLGEPVPLAKRQSIAAYLNWTYGVSVLPKQGLQFGYLAGFECQAYEESLRNGHYPRVKLLEATGAVAPLGHALIATVEDLDAKMEAAITRDIEDLIEQERSDAEAETARREYHELVAECAHVLMEGYEKLGLHERNVFDLAEVQAAFEHDVPRDLVTDALARAATRKGSGARAYAEAMVASVYDLGSDGPPPNLEPS